MRRSDVQMRIVRVSRIMRIGHIIASEEMEITACSIKPQRLVCHCTTFMRLEFVLTHLKLDA